MIYTSYYRRRYFDKERFQPGNLKDGETFSIDSQMGGSFLIEFVGWDEERLHGHWKVITPGWEKISYLFTVPAMVNNIYTLVKEIIP